MPRACRALGLTAFLVCPAWALVAPSALGRSLAARPLPTLSRCTVLGRLGTGPTGYVCPGEVDEEALLAASSFPIKPPELVELAKRVMGEYKAGTEDESILDESFVFCAPFVGPLSRAEYLGVRQMRPGERLRELRRRDARMRSPTQALRSFKIEEAFPDNNPQYHHWRHVSRRVRTAITVTG